MCRGGESPTQGEIPRQLFEKIKNNNDNDNNNHNDKVKKSVTGGHLVDVAPPVFLICFVCSFVKNSKFSKISLISKRMLQPSNVCGKSHNFLLPQRNRSGKMRRLHFHHLLLPQRLCTRNRCGKLKTLFRKNYTCTIFCCRSCCVPGVDGAS